MYRLYVLSQVYTFKNTLIPTVEGNQINLSFFDKFCIVLSVHILLVYNNCRPNLLKRKFVVYGRVLLLHDAAVRLERDAIKKNRTKSVLIVYT